MTTGLQLIERNICSLIIERLDKAGLLYRIFSRAKPEKSLLEKIERKKKESKPYSKNGKKLQDIIGVRIVTYFQDDINLVKEILSDTLKFIDEEIDVHDLTVFKPKRTNIICKLDAENSRTFKEIQSTYRSEILELVDSTIELQLRTVLSEGWHEIDHSLRYKCKSEWEDHVEKERMLNGIYASLEVNDIALKSLFKELSYQHFKSKNWEAMFRNKFRLKFGGSDIKPELRLIFDNNTLISKEFLKIDRDKIIGALAKTIVAVPVNFNNLIFFINSYWIKDSRIAEITPEFIKTCRE